MRCHGAKPKSATMSDGNEEEEVNREEAETEADDLVLVSDSSLASPLSPIRSRRDSGSDSRSVSSVFSRDSSPEPHQEDNKSAKSQKEDADSDRRSVSSAKESSDETGSDSEAEGAEEPRDVDQTQPKRKRVVLDSSSEDEDDGNDEAPQEKDEERAAEDVGEEMPTGKVEATSDGAPLDFDLMMERRRALNRRRRKRNDIDIINDNDDAIARLVADMRNAALEDRELFARGLPATNKIAMLPMAMEKISKVDLQYAFVEANLLSVLTDWLAPMPPPDRSLPHVQIRTELLKFLRALHIHDLSCLKESGIGKAVMYLYRHPKENRANKDLAGKIINKWARPIFNVQADYSTMTKADRQQRDEELARKARRIRAAAAAAAQRAQPKAAATASTSIGEAGTLATASTSRVLRPGDPGWVYRARVPMLDERDYVIRPGWQSHEDMAAVAKKKPSRIELRKRRLDEVRKMARTQQAVKISIEGRNIKDVV